MNIETMKHDYQKALDRIKRNVMPCDAWTEEDWDHFETVKDALELAASVVRCKDCRYWDDGDCYRLEWSMPTNFCSYGEKR